MNEFIFIDGADGIGKTTIAKSLIEKYYITKPNTFTVFDRLPSNTGSLSFIRDILKSREFHCDEFARQVLHSCNHINKFYEHSLMSNPDSHYIHQVHIFDRGPVSTLVYGDLLIEDKSKLDILYNINFNVLIELLQTSIDKVTFLNLYKEKPYRKEDNSYYEEKTSFNEIQEKYHYYSNVLKEKSLEHILVKEFTIPENITNEELTNIILEIL